MIPINSAVDSNCWLKITRADEEEGLFKIRLVDFRKVLRTEIDKSDDINEEFSFSEGYIYLLKLDLVNLCEETRGASMLDDIILVDQDEFKFERIEDAHLSYDSKFAVTSGLKKFYSPTFTPKIKYDGAITYFLPKNDKANYFITDPNDDISEL